MLDFGFYNMDCMEGMKQFPDKYFDLAVVDPPYGDGGGSGQALNASENGSTDTVTMGGYVNPLSAKELPTARRHVGCRELAEDGRGGSIRQKNYSVGRSAETGIFR